MHRLNDMGFGGDELGHIRTMSSKQQAYTVQRTSPLGSDGVVYCNHGERAVMRTSQTPTHPGREFWVCKRPRGDPEQCGFFYWVDDPMVMAAHPETSQHGGSQSRSPARSKRLEDIRRGLREREAGQDTIQVDTFNRPPSATDSIRPAAPAPLALSSQHSSPSVNWEKELPPATPTHARYSFLGLYSPTISPQASPAVSPATPQKRRRLLELDEELHPGPLTPPETMRRPAAGASIKSRPDPVTPTRNKGKERAVENEMNDNAEDEDNLFMCGLSSLGVGERLPLEATSVSQFPDNLYSSPSSDAPTPAEEIIAILTEMKHQVESQRTLMQRLQDLGGMDYIAKLERGRNSLHLSNEFKKKKIAELTDEVRSLKNRISLLEKENREKDVHIAALGLT